jgi:hypothetical protein
LQISQGYIIHILQHFATKLWNITNFVMLFQAVMKFFGAFYSNELMLKDFVNGNFESTPVQNYLRQKPNWVTTKSASL